MDRGQTTTEYVAIIAMIAGIVGGLSVSGISGQIGDALSSAICTLTQQDGCGTSQQTAAETKVASQNDRPDHVPPDRRDPDDRGQITRVECEEPQMIEELPPGNWSDRYEVDYEESGQEDYRPEKSYKEAYSEPPLGDLRVGV